MTSYRYANPGEEFVVGPDGKAYSVPVTADRAMQLSHQMGGLGQHPQSPAEEGIEHSPQFRDYTKIPTWYIINITLAGIPGATAGGGVQLRPEPFVAKRLTWATSGDVFPNVNADDGGPNGGSIQGRAVQVEWQDEFTRFMGSRQSLLSAQFGDSQGYLDFPRGILLQGKQSLSVALTRLFWPSSSDEADTLFDFVFHGLALLPPGQNYSGGGR